jgi:hypothetical protein
VFFRSSAELANESNTGTANGGQDLYRYDFNAAHPNEKLKDLTVDTNSADSAMGANVQGVVGIANDGSYVYFVATGQLVAGRGVDGAPNLYLWHEGPQHEGITSFIATLNIKDSHDWTETPAESQAYVTPDGLHLAFMSLNSLTGYDNRDASTAAPDSEVFEYDAGTGIVTCASCRPDGQRPTGSAFLGAGLSERTSTPFAQPRTLSDDGRRLFFSSPDALAAAAAGTHVKVYEYEEGRIGLISSGVNSADDVFLDASATGDDVFFATRDRLAAADRDNNVDIYDAHVEGVPPPLATPAPCAGSACQGPMTVAPSLLSVGSSTIVGFDNLAPVQRRAGSAAVKKTKKKRVRKRKRKLRGRASINTRIGRRSDGRAGAAGPRGRARSEGQKRI